MKFQLKFDCDNAAFGDSDETRSEEIVRIMRALAHDLDEYPLRKPIAMRAVRDVNGNVVGTAQIIGGR